MKKEMSQYHLDENAMPVFVGVDGCRAGWLSIALMGVDKWEVRLLRDTEALGDLADRAALMLVDMPIGLLASGSATVQRLCDVEARRCLGRPRSSSVFPVPTRAALSANSYTAALQINRQQLGCGISRQAWNIGPKIAQIDRLLRERTELRSRVRECHPEVCFWSLNDSQTMRYNKKLVEGREERLCVLQKYLSFADDILQDALSQFRRNEVAVDDIIDATVVALTAKLGHDGLLTLPSQPPFDEMGLPMEIVYAWEYRQDKTCK